MLWLSLLLLSDSSEEQVASSVFSCFAEKCCIQPVERIAASSELMLIQLEGTFALLCKHRSSNNELRILNSLRHVLPKQLKSNLYCIQKTHQIISSTKHGCKNFPSV